MKTFAGLGPIIVVLALTACGKPEPGDRVGSVVATAAQKSIWIDVRTADEFSTGHIEGALQMSHDEISLEHPVLRDVVSAKDTPIRLYCGSGHRSGIAQRILQDLGYTVVENVGGFEEAARLAESETNREKKLQ